MAARRPSPNASPPLPPPLSAWIARLGSHQRISAGIAFAIVAYFALSDSLAWHTRLVASWNVGVIVYLCLAWTIVWRADARSTRDHALAQDTSGVIIFLFVLGAACASIVAIGFDVATIKGLTLGTKAKHLAMTVVALTSSWVLIQTVFVFHYARRYYRDADQGPAESGGLAFPGGGEPDYMDFAYYSFVVGMTSQVSDVEVQTSAMRHMTLVHGVLAFIFNIAVLALAINTISSAL